MAGKHRRENGALQGKDRATIRMDAELLDTLKEMAEDQRRSLSNLLEMMLERQVREHEQQTQGKQPEENSG